jgi:hypothetical protein
MIGTTWPSPPRALTATVPEMSTNMPVPTSPVLTT